MNGNNNNIIIFIIIVAISMYVKSKQKNNWQMPKQQFQTQNYAYKSEEEVEKEVKAVVSGIYIMDIKHSRNNLEAPSKTKVGKLAKLRMKAQKALDDNKK